MYATNLQKTISTIRTLTKAVLHVLQCLKLHCGRLVDKAQVSNKCRIICDVICSVTKCIRGPPPPSAEVMGGNVTPNGISEQDSF